MSKDRLNLICIDGSEHSDRAFNWYCESLHRENDILGLVHIHELPYIPVGIDEDGLFLESLTSVTIEQSVEKSKKIVEKYTELCAEKKITAVSFLTTCDDSIGHTICKVSKENNAATIIIGARGLGVIRRTLLGSVSDYVLHHAHIPTVVIPPEEEKS